MTLSRLEQTNRVLRKAAAEVAREGSLTLPRWKDQIVEAVEEHLGWDLDEREAAVAYQAFWAEVHGRTACLACDGRGCEFCPRVDG